MKLLSPASAPAGFMIVAFALFVTWPFSAYAQRLPPIDRDLASKVIDQPQPAMPAAARVVGASGKVTVEVTVDETGTVTSATATSGHPLLRTAAEQAALKARFKPSSIKRWGILSYTFGNTSGARSASADDKTSEKKDAAPATIEIPLGSGDAETTDKPAVEQAAVQKPAAETPAAGGGFAAGHRLEGRYKLRGAFKYFTFSSDGSVKLSAAAAGEFRGGDYAAGGEAFGKYSLKGHSLTVVMDNGGSKTYEIEIYRCCETPNYAEKSPPVIKINSALYDNVD